MWATCTYDFGIPEEQFWTMVPAQFFALMERQEREDNRQHMLVAGVQLLLAKAHLKPPPGKKGWTIEDFMPKSWVEETQEAKNTAPDWRNMLATVEQLNKAFGGKDLRRKK